MIAWLLLATLTGQTRPRPEQIRNPDQVRICSASPACVDPRPGTLLSIDQIQDGRQKVPEPASVDPADAGKPTVCIVTYIGINLEEGGYVLAVPVCFSQLGLAELLTDPEWAAWWSAQP